jgi:hypothetical protein
MESLAALVKKDTTAGWPMGKECYCDDGRGGRDIITAKVLVWGSTWEDVITALVKKNTTAE